MPFPAWRIETAPMVNHNSRRSTASPATSSTTFPLTSKVAKAEISCWSYHPEDEYLRSLPIPASILTAGPIRYRHVTAVKPICCSTGSLSLNRVDTLGPVPKLAERTLGIRLDRAVDSWLLDTRELSILASPKCKKFHFAIFVGICRHDNQWSIDRGR